MSFFSQKNSDTIKIISDDIRLNIKEETKFAAQIGNSSIIHGQKLCICKNSGRIYLINLHYSENYLLNSEKMTCAHISNLNRVCPP